VRFGLIRSGQVRYGPVRSGKFRCDLVLMLRIRMKASALKRALFAVLMGLEHFAENGLHNIKVSYVNPPQ